MFALALSVALAASPTSTPGLAKAGEFAGKRILFLSYYEVNPPQLSPYVPGVLRELGFAVDVVEGAKALPSLEKYDQLWLMSGGPGTAWTDADTAALKRFLARGRGLYVMGDNVPYVRQVGLIGAALHGINVDGDYQGDQTVSVLSRARVEALIAEARKKGDLGKLAEYRRAGMLNGTFYAEDHELLTGISQIYEGITICHFSPSKDLEVILSASNNESLVAVSKVPGQRMLYDCGYTRLFNDWARHAETNRRWYQNVAAWLMGKRRADLPRN